MKVLKVLIALLGVGFIAFWIYAENMDLIAPLELLISGLAFLVPTYTVLLQHEELRLQRRDLQETKEELRKSAEAQAAQSTSMRKTALLNGYAAKLSHHSNERKYYASLSAMVEENTHREYSNEAATRINELLADLESPGNKGI